MSKRGDRMTSAVEEMSQDAEQMVDAMMEIIERVTVGNPRLMKKERKVLSLVLHAVVRQLAAYSASLTVTDDLRQRLEALNDQHKIGDDLQAQINQQMRQILRMVREMIEDRRYDDAVGLIDQVLRGPKRD